IVAENAAGAIIAERVAPVRVRGCGPRLRGSGAQFRSWIDGLAAAVRPRIAAATAPWRDESADADAAFRSTRLGRERAIANRAGSTQPPAYQAGLFDRRAARARATADALESVEAIEAADRIARFAPSIASWSIELALVAIGR
ncbi:MAG TPA: hypothetical protein VKH42_16810, partial [Vicinamibacterales bacterium]|nr:hypothetical protein [Vicinamibacterales bacterium]